MLIQEESLGKMLDTKEEERQLQLARTLAKYVGSLMWVGVAMVWLIWWFQPKYTQFIWYGLLLACPAVLALLHPIFETRKRLKLWSILFMVFTTDLAIIIPLLVPDAL
jgi:hypothetical protein